MARDFNASLSKREVAVGFLFVLCVASSLAVPANTLSVSSSSVATPLGSAQMVASASDRDEGLSAVASEPAAPPPPPPLESDGDKQQTGAVVPPPASEAGDMMKDPYHNVTNSTSDREEEAEIDSETDTVQDSHVSPINKTHEEEASDTPLDSSTQQHSVQGGSPVLTTESSTSKVDKTENEEKTEDKEDTDKTTEEVDVTEKGGDVVSLAEQVTSLPVSALVSQHDAHEHPVIGKTSSLNHTTQAAAILAGVLVMVAIMGYLGLLLWRRVLEKRYGNREMLVDDEEDDFRHFEL